MGMQYTIGGGPLTNAGAPSAGTTEVQTLTIGGTPSGGTMTFSFEGFTSSPVTWSGSDDSALVAAIDAALEAMPSIGTGGITAAAGTLSSGIGTITLTWAGNHVKLAKGLISVTSALTGSSPTAAITETTAGVTATHRGAPPGAQLIDTTNKIAYINTGTALAPTWTKTGTQS